MTTEVTQLREAEQEVVLAEAQSVFAMVEEGPFRGDLAALISAVQEGELGPEERSTLEQLLELGLQAGRIRAVYGPGGEQAALSLYRRLPRGAELAGSARGVTEALAALRGLPIESISVQAVGPGAFTLSLAAGGSELSVRLDRQGARLASVGV
jgi:hypothetical protein